MIDFVFEKNLTAANGNLHLSVNGHIEENELIVLQGKSGAGKTSILRLFAGLMQADKGFLKVANEIWLDNQQGIFIKPQKRKIGFVFQDYALFPNMTVEENLRFALEKKQETHIITDLIDLIELGELRNRKPQQLSGGQQQRVALARALVRQPKLLLLDEPLSALDQEMREKLQDYLLKIHQTFKLTTLLVSHDLSEIIKMADRVFVLENGVFTKKAKPLELFSPLSKTGKFSGTGTILSIEEGKHLMVLIGNDLVRIVYENIEKDKLAIGDKIQVSSTVFEPKIEIMK